MIRDIRQSTFPKQHRKHGNGHRRESRLPCCTFIFGVRMVDIAVPLRHRRREMHDHASQDSLRNSSASSIYLLSSSLSCHLSCTLAQISGCNGDAHDVCTVMYIAFLRRWNAKVCLVATWITKNISPRRTANAMCALVATQTVRGVLGGAANSGHRDRHVIATTLKDLPHANRNA